MSRAQVDTFEQMDEVDGLLQNLFDKIKSSKDLVNKTDHQIIGKASVFKITGQKINFHFILSRLENSTSIVFYGEYYNINGPFKEFLIQLLVLLELRIHKSTHF